MSPRRLWSPGGAWPRSSSSGDCSAGIASRPSWPPWAAARRPGHRRARRRPRVRPGRLARPGAARAASRDVELARVYRSGLREGSHYGALVVVDRDGSVLWQRGDVRRPVFQRSCAKPFQAVAMLTAGAPVGGPDLALAAASHTGEEEHVVRVLDLLTAGRVTEQDLGCPADLPTDRAARDAVIRAGGRPRRVYMNCSGKHAAMLGTCRAAGWPRADYLAPEHPLQQLIRSSIADLTGETAGTPSVSTVAAHRSSPPAWSAWLAASALWSPHLRELPAVGG